MPPEFRELGPIEKLEALYQVGLIDIKEGSAWPTPVRYLEADSGLPLQDIWAYQPYTEGTVSGTSAGIDADVAWLGTTDPERMGYQTQKPEGLLERIIQSSCPEDGIVLDPFCGCGTTIAAAQKLGRKWIGIDITYLSIRLQKKRIREMFGNIPYTIIGEPVDLLSAQELAKNEDGRYQFQWWALSLIDAQPLGAVAGSKVGKKGSDRGIDGIIPFIDREQNKPQRVLVSVKSGDNVSVRDVRDLVGTIDREKAAIGVLITLKEPTAPMEKEALTAGYYQSDTWIKGQGCPRIQILTITDLLAGKQVIMPQAAGIAGVARKARRVQPAKQVTFDAE